jgi:hypothetical protein
MKETKAARLKIKWSRPPKWRHIERTLKIYNKEISVSRKLKRELLWRRLLLIPRVLI